jgi:hypothetical protein
MSLKYKSYLDALMNKKIKRIAQPKKIIVSLDDLPNETIGEIFKYLSDEDLINIGSTSQKYYEGWLSKLRSDQCGRDTREALNICIGDAMGMFDEDRVPSRFEHDGKSTDGSWITYGQSRCTREGVCHDIRCEFIKFSRDVDILTCYIDKECVLNNMM